MSENHAASNIVKTGTNVKITEVTEVKKRENKSSYGVVTFHAKKHCCVILLTPKVFLNCNDLLDGKNAN